MAKKNTYDGYIDSVGDYFKKLPELPRGGREFFVMVLPWIALIFGALGVLSAISAFGIFSYFAPGMYWGGVDVVGRGMISVVLSLVSSVLLLMAFKGTKEKRSQGWKLFYYSEVVMLVSSIVLFSVAGIIMNLLGFYILYQIRSYFR